ncbi:hypothetical protein TEA_003022 [Camellia sinensis var. sinensis]|uniref:Uncharacterized protein n=1 Tax=Camellia sinensis var. sinensis TaxID=542762 RepID=A0A4S4D6J1_CAMSN|nr:hypothetical protein TEA_003022 [Camellia sinensis var. sinensis]
MEEPEKRRTKERRTRERREEPERQEPEKRARERREEESYQRRREEEKLDGLLERKKRETQKTFELQSNSLSPSVRILSKNAGHAPMAIPVLALRFPLGSAPSIPKHRHGNTRRVLRCNQGMVLGINKPSHPHDRHGNTRRVLRCNQGMVLGINKPGHPHDTATLHLFLVQPRNQLHLVGVRMPGNASANSTLRMDPHQHPLPKTGARCLDHHVSIIPAPLENPNEDLGLG